MRLCVFFFAVFLPEHPLLILVLRKQDEQRHLALCHSKNVPVPAYLQPEHPIYIGVSDMIQKIRFLFHLCHYVKAAVVHWLLVCCCSF
jgi:hypothetical protein